MSADPKTQLRVFFHTLSTRIKNTSASISGISTFEDSSLQLTILESACLTLKNACVFEYGQFLEHAKSYPHKFDEECLTAVEFSKMTESLKALISNSIERINDILIKPQSNHDHDDPLMLQIFQHIDSMLERMKRCADIKDSIIVSSVMKNSQNMHCFLSAPIAAVITVTGHDVVLSGESLIQIKN